MYILEFYLNDGHIFWIMLTDGLRHKEQGLVGQRKISLSQYDKADDNFNNNITAINLILNVILKISRLLVVLFMFLFQKHK